MSSTLKVDAASGMMIKKCVEEKASAMRLLAITVPSVQASEFKLCPTTLLLCPPSSAASSVLRSMYVAVCLLEIWDAQRPAVLGKPTSVPFNVLPFADAAHLVAWARTSEVDVNFHFHVSPEGVYSLNFRASASTRQCTLTVSHPLPSAATLPPRIRAKLSSASSRLVALAGLVTTSPHNMRALRVAMQRFFPDFEVVVQRTFGGGAEAKVSFVKGSRAIPVRDIPQGYATLLALVWEIITASVDAEASLIDQMDNNIPESLFQQLTAWLSEQPCHKQHQIVATIAKDPRDRDVQQIGVLALDYGEWRSLAHSKESDRLQSLASLLLTETAGASQPSLTTTAFRLAKSHGSLATLALLQTSVEQILNCTKTVQFHVSNGGGGKQLCVFTASLTSAKPLPVRTVQDVLEADFVIVAAESLADSKESRHVEVHNVRVRFENELSIFPSYLGFHGATSRYSLCDCDSLEHCKTLNSTLEIMLAEQRPSIVGA